MPLFSNVVGGAVEKAGAVLPGASSVTAKVNRWRSGLTKARQTGSLVALVGRTPPGIAGSMALKVFQKSRGRPRSAGSPARSRSAARHLPV